MLNVRIPSNKRESVRNRAQDLVLNIKEKRMGFIVSFKIRMCEKKIEVVIFFLDFMKMNEKQYEYYFVFAMYEINRVYFVQMTDLLP